jgi:hypothetical protein
MIRLSLVLCAALLVSCGKLGKPVATSPAVPPTVPGKAFTVSSWEPWVKQATGPDSIVEIKPDVPETAADPAAPPRPPRPPRPPLSAEAKAAGVLVLSGCKPFTTVKYTGPDILDLKGYEIAWESMRLEGADFFSSLTFPVGNLKQCVSFVNGGWGGTVVGISCIGYAFANEGPASGGYNFVNGRWYDFTLQVTPEVIRALINGTQQFKVTVKGQALTMHPSEITTCVPLGFAAYSCTGAIRNVRIRPLNPGELVPDPEQ